MGLQLIFVVETNKKCRSDWIYIKSALEKFYSYDQAHVKLSVVYMDGRGNYAKRENDAQKLIKQYQATSKNNESKVFVTKMSSIPFYIGHLCLFISYF